MAELRVEGTDVVLHLSAAERLESVHGDLREPRSAVQGVDIVEDAHSAADVLGVKVGTRLPGVVEVATVYASQAKMFVAVHRDTPRGVRVRFAGADYDEWVVGCADPEATREALVAPTA